MGVDKLHVSFRGTTGLTDWLTNFTAWLRPGENYEGLLHQGFQEAANSCYEHMVPQLDAAAGEHPITEYESTFLFQGGV